MTPASPYRTALASLSRSLALHGAAKKTKSEEISGREEFVCWEDLRVQRKHRVWTDQYNSILSALQGLR